MNPSSDRRGMLMSSLMFSLMASLLVACGPEQEPAADVEVSERSEVTTLAQAITTGTPVSLINRGSGKCMEVAGSNMKDGGGLYLWNCHGGENQKFYLKSDGAGGYVIIAKHSGRYVSLGFTNNQYGAAIYQYGFIGGENQKFALVDLGNGYYTIRPKLNSALVSVVSDNWDNGSLIAVGLGSNAAAEFRLGL